MYTRIVAVDCAPLDVALHTPFGIATGAQVHARNLLVTVRLDDGTVGLGEAAPFPAVNGETQASAAAAIARVAPDWVGRDARAWRSLSAGLDAALVGAGAARCALETALLDALCRHYRVPMRVFFGGVEQELVTDVTITTGTAAEAARDAARWAAAGFATLKIKVGGQPLAADADRLRAIAAAAPGAALILDGNGALAEPRDAVALIDAVTAAGARVVLLEQPLAKGDLDGARALRGLTAAPVAADEAVGGVADVLAVARAGAADVVNLKTTKSGLIGALDMALAARAHGLGLMIGAMVETPLALSASAALAAGLGGFRFVDLDTHLWMIDPPVTAGFAQDGPRLRLADAPGHGAAVRRPGSGAPSAGPSA